nr:MAG TPA: hypothetical protein [Caudoviricetes sp.]
MNVIYVLLCVIAVQTLIIVGMSIVQHMERKDLYNRLMCRNIAEYSNIKANEPTQPISKHKAILDRWRKKGVKVGDE